MNGILDMAQRPEPTVPGARQQDDLGDTRASAADLPDPVGALPAPAKLAADQTGTDARAPEPAVVDPSADPAPAIWAGPALRILVAEDNVINRKLLLLLLRHGNHVLTEVDNGRRAVDAWEQGAFDLVLMDIMMPELDGSAAARLIRERERERGGHTPIIALTAHAMRNDRQKYLSQGFDGYVSKPIVLKQLTEEIQRCLKSRPA